MAKVKRALISVSDKFGIVDFAKGLDKLGIEILSTGGTAKLLRDGGVKVRDVSDFTGFPEMLDGRVKTLHPKVHGGLLALRGNKEHMETVKKHGIGLIDMVVVNLYPFEKTVAKPARIIAHKCSYCFFKNISSLFLLTHSFVFWMVRSSCMLI